MISHVRRALWAAMSSVGLGFCVVSAAQTVDPPASTAGGGAALTAMVTSVQVDAVSPLGSPMGSTSDQPNLTSLIDAAQGPALLAPEHVGSFVLQSRVATVDLGIASAHDAAEVDVTRSGRFLGPDRPAASFNADAAPSTSETPAPEPTSYALMLLSLGVVAWLKLHGR